MFTAGAVALVIVIALAADRTNKRDRREYDATPDDLRMRVLLLHVRQDVKLIAFALGGILVMLGVIADRMR